jgi:hypothetical protein
MQFSAQFFPDVRPEEKSARAYFTEAPALASLRLFAREVMPRFPAGVR